ncbi:MAG TPA: cytochrome c [Solirubrobacteraceae bacterium]|nr:cytochrome c [Solirubrobacteraceae bacterium]
MSVRAKIAATATILLVCALALGGCGSQGIGIAKSSSYRRGAVLFRDHCSGCHTLSVVGAQGSATSIKNRLRTNGPNFNIRNETEEQVLYAIRNGGFSGAFMPENIVLGAEAKAVAQFLSHYAGRDAPTEPSTPISQSITNEPTTSPGVKEPGLPSSKQRTAPSSAAGSASPAQTTGSGPSAKKK